MPELSLDFDTTKFERSIASLSRYVKTDGPTLLKQQARGFVRRVIDMTPPGSERVRGASAKRQGEMAVRADMRKLFTPRRFKVKTKAKHTDLAALHKRHRNQRGRVNGRPRYSVKTEDFRTYEKEMLAQIGTLAAGWNAAARALGVRVPAWISRHGSRYGTVEIRLSGNTIWITVSNKVPFVGSVGDLSRRVQFALNAQADAMERQIKVLLAKAAKKAGL